MNTDILGSKLTSRKFWAFLLTVIGAIAGLFTGEITFLQFLTALVLAAATYQTAETVTDTARAHGVENTMAQAAILDVQQEHILERLQIEHDAHDVKNPVSGLGMTVGMTKN